MHLKPWVYSYLNPQKLCSGPWRCQVFKLSGPLIGEYCSSSLVFSIPLDRPATIQEILAGIVTSECQEISSCTQLLNVNVPGSLWDQSNVYIA